MTIVAVTMFSDGTEVFLSATSQNHCVDASRNSCDDYQFGVDAVDRWPFIGPLLGMEIGAGMVATFAAPCTLVSAAVWPRRAGGDDRIAILVTLITNLFCFLTTPFWVGANGQIRPGNVGQLRENSR